MCIQFQVVERMCKQQQQQQMLKRNDDDDDDDEIKEIQICWSIIHYFIINKFANSSLLIYLNGADLTHENICVINDDDEKRIKYYCSH